MERGGEREGDGGDEKGAGEQDTRGQKKHPLFLIFTSKHTHTSTLMNTHTISIFCSAKGTEKEASSEDKQVNLSF